MVVYMKESSKIMIFMDMGFTYGQMIRDMRESGIEI